MSGNVFLGWAERLTLLGFETVLGRYYGEYDGIVKDNKDPAGKGRVQVVVPATGLGDAVSIPTWATPIFSTACGAGHGGFWPPEVGDHVMVSFDFGDMAKPVYKGGSYGAGGIPPEFDPGKGKAPTKRGWKSIAGHFFRFNDTPGSESTTWGSAGKSMVHLDNGVFIASNGGTSVFQMKDGTIVLLDNAGNVISSSASGWTIQNGKVFIELKGDTVQIVGAKVAVAGNVSLGPGANTEAVRYMELSLWLATHTHPTFNGPSGPPMQAGTVSSFKSKSVMLV